jgi:hypothetical protein
MVILATLTFLLSACSERERVPVVGLKEFVQKNPFRATVERVYSEKTESFGQVVFVTLKTETGEKIAVGGEGVDERFRRFAESLERGKRYEFPQAWIDYLRDPSR